MSPDKFIKLDIVLPVGDEIMLASNNLECFETAHKAIRADSQHLRSDKFVHADSSSVPYEKHKVQIEFKSGTDTKKLLPHLVGKVAKALAEKGISDCELIAIVD